MQGISKPKYTKEEISQEFNLEEILGYTPSKKQKELFAELVIEQIFTRTTDGKNINGRKFKKYTAEYAEKKGVSRDSVDMVLEGEMLTSMDDKIDGNKIKVGIEGDTNILKGYNHNTGDTVPKRTFFGVTQKKEIKKIVGIVDSVKESPKEQSQTLKDVRDALKSLTIGFEN